MILILTEELDPHADLVVEALRRKGAPCARFHTADFPQRAGLVLRWRDGQEGGILRLPGQEIDLKEIRTVWYRRPKPPEFPAGLAPQDREFARDESTHALRGLWALLRGRFWVNPRELSLAAENKPYQLDLARSIGLEVPRTLVTNDPAEIAPFLERCRGEAVYKPFTQYSRREGDRMHMIYTNRLRREDLARVEALKLAPGLFQEYVPKKVELRVTVIGRKVFAAEIYSQKSERAKEDWRRYDLPNTPHLPHALPPDVKARCLELVRRLGLVFGCIDLILTPDDRYVFLEINPNGQWYWIEQLTGLPLIDHFSEMLIQAAPDYAAPANSFRVSPAC